jgi:hypothetical protein
MTALNLELYRKLYLIRKAEESICHHFYSLFDFILLAMNHLTNIKLCYYAKEGTY